MTCVEFEVLLADYLDGTLSAAESAAFEQHASACAGCQQFLEDASRGAQFLKQADDITPPAELITRIAFQAPRRRVKDPFEREGMWRKFANKWLQPILQPRLAMGMAMTILSFAMLERCTGMRIQRIEPADLNPVRIWGNVEDKVIRAKDRTVKYYENLKWVYEIETRLKVFEQQPDQAPSGGKKPADRNHRPEGKKK